MPTSNPINNTDGTLVIHLLYKRFSGREVLKGASLRAKPGTAIALLGKNGTGKSTLLGIAAGLIEPESGSVTFQGESLLDKNGKAKRHIGYVPEAANAPAFLSAAEYLSLIATLKKSTWPSAELLDKLGVSILLNQRIGSLSLGQRRRTCLAAALIGQPSVFILDEPTNGLDPSGVDLLAGLLRSHLSETKANGERGTALIATHDLAFADAIGAIKLRLSDGQVTEA